MKSILYFHPIYTSVFQEVDSLQFFHSDHFIRLYLIILVMSEGNYKV